MQHHSIINSLSLFQFFINESVWEKSSSFIGLIKCLDLRLDLDIPTPTEQPFIPQVTRL